MAGRGPRQLCMADNAGQPVADRAAICTSMMLITMRTWHAQQHASCMVTCYGPKSNRDACCLMA